MASYIQQLIESQTQANQANEQRRQQAMKLYDKRIAMFQPGGSFGKGVEAQLTQARRTSIGQGMQHLAGAGLYNTTIGAGLSTQFEREVGAPTRARVEDMRMTSLSDALMAKAGVLERAEDIGPDPSLVASLANQSSYYSGLGSTSGRTTFGASSFAKPTVYRAPQYANTTPSTWNRGTPSRKKSTLPPLPSLAEQRKRAQARMSTAELQKMVDQQSGGFRLPY